MDLILIGAGGHAKSCIVCAESAGINIVGLVDSHYSAGDNVLGYPVLGDDSKLENLVRENYSFLLAVGQIEDSILRRKLTRSLESLGAHTPIIKASTSFISKNVDIAAGTIIMHQTVVNAKSTIGMHCIINTGAIIEHDVRIGDFVHISTGAVINGNCSIGNDCFVGSGAVIKNGMSICNEAVIGAGAVVVHNITEKGIYVGCPAKKIK